MKFMTSNIATLTIAIVRIAAAPRVSEDARSAAIAFQSATMSARANEQGNSKAARVVRTNPGPTIFMRRMSVSSAWIFEAAGAGSPEQRDLEVASSLATGSDRLSAALRRIVVKQLRGGAGLRVARTDTKMGSGCRPRAC